MREPLVETVAARPQPRLRPLVADYTGYRIEGAEPGVHRGLPSRHVTFIVTLDGPVDLAAMPDPRQPPGSFTTLVAGLHAAPALIGTTGTSTASSSSSPQDRAARDPARAGPALHRARETDRSRSSPSAAARRAPRRPAPTACPGR
ncbi:MAG: hypothetical protein GEU83_17940 [Pseudonocardiaceae bacterium]|nr:hypothetical protein [Pseudonocardiaceae bacterium]